MKAFFKRLLSNDEQADGAVVAASAAGAGAASSPAALAGPPPPETDATYSELGALSVGIAKEIAVHTRRALHARGADGGRRATEKVALAGAKKVVAEAAPIIASKLGAPGVEAYWLSNTLLAEQIRGSAIALERVERGAGRKAGESAESARSPLRRIPKRP